MKQIERLRVFINIGLLFFVSVANGNLVTNATQNFDGLPDAVTETLRILEAGDREIVLDLKHREVILVVGMTGAGKSTMTKFLAEDNSNLISYEAVDGRYLIRDPDNKISVGTLISKSIFPELVLHRDEVTNVTTAFYDCPGFSDTRNSSVEIANAFFIKRVADHALRLKILFVVNYSSLQSGQSRTAFKELLEQTTRMIRNIGKFRQGISLIATKVDSRRSDQSLMQGIAGFLKAARRDLEQLGSLNKRMQDEARDLIDAFLVQDAQNGGGNGPLSYKHIGLFRQPDELGPLSQIEVVQRMKPMLEQMVFGNGTEFVEKSLEDFKVSVSDKAKLLVAQTAEVINNKLANHVQILMENLQARFLSKVKMADSLSKKLDVLPKLRSEKRSLENFTSLLTTKERREDFYNTTLAEYQNQQRGPGLVTDLLKNINSDLAKLSFLEQLRENGDPLPGRHVQWLQPFISASKNFTQEIFYFETLINSQMTQVTSKIGEFLQEHLEEKIKSNSSLDQTLRDFQMYHKSLSSLMDDLANLHVFGDILIRLRNVVYKVGGEHQNFTRSKANMLNLLDDLNMAGADLNISVPSGPEENNPFNPDDWIRPFRNLSTYLQNTKYDLALKINREVEQNMKNLAESLQQLLESQETIRQDSSMAIIELYSETSRDMSNLIANLKEAKSMASFLSNLQDGFMKLDPQLLNDNELKTQLEFYNNQGQDRNLQLFEPMSGKVSPFKPINWILALESVQKFVESRVVHFSAIVQEKKEAAATKLLEEQLEQEKAEAARQLEEQRLAEEKHKKERLAARKREKQAAEKERLDRLRHEQEQRQLRWRIMQLEEQHRAEQRREWERQYRRELEEQRRRDERDQRGWWTKLRDKIFG